MTYDVTPTHYAPVCRHACTQAGVLSASAALVCATPRLPSASRPVREPSTQYTRAHSVIRSVTHFYSAHTEHLIGKFNNQNSLSSSLYITTSHADNHRTAF